jgi:hypothetical protein
MRLDHIEPEFVEFIPPELAEGKLYVSMIYATTVHLCACGCGNKVVLPLSPAEWQMFFDGEAVSLTPSIGNWEFPCRSHYWIKGNAIKWAAPWTAKQIEAGRRRDQADLDSYFTSRGAVQSSEQSTGETPRRKRWLERIRRLFRH